jgi:hypothetical protein
MVPNYPLNSVFSIPSNPPYNTIYFNFHATQKD